MIRTMTALLATMTLVACTEGKPLPTPFEVPADASRFYADRFQDLPFDEAAVTVLTTEGGDLRTYTLTPCANGTGICGSRTGTIQRTPDYFVVSGAYPGRTFYLSPGGDGFLETTSGNINLAWN